MPYNNKPKLGPSLYVHKKTIHALPPLVRVDSVLAELETWLGANPSIGRIVKH